MKKIPRSKDETSSDSEDDNISVKSSSSNSSTSSSSSNSSNSSTSSGSSSSSSSSSSDSDSKEEQRGGVEKKEREVKEKEDVDDVLDLPIPDQDEKNAQRSVKKLDNVSEYRSKSLYLGTRLPHPRFTKFERARLIGTRATQIQGGMPDLLTPEEREQVSGPVNRAKLELLLRKTPFIIDRELPDGTKELVTVQEME